MGVAYNDVRYMKTPLSRAELERLVAILDGPVEDLVRKDSRFASLGLDAAPLVGNRSAVVATLTEHPQLMQRPVLVRGGKAIIGRPKDRVATFLA